MIKNDLVKRIAVKFGLSLTLAEKIVQTLLDELIFGLITDSNVELRRFGVFAVKRQGPRVITLPSGKKIKRPPQKIVTFTLSPTVKKALNPPSSRSLKKRLSTRRKQQ